MAAIVAAGELLAEFVAAKRGQGFDAPGEFAGPFPSGAPAIFADQAARMGASVAYAGCVGRDAFGDAIVARLAGHGVDVARIRRAARPTGIACVAYRADGGRQFMFSIEGSASALLEPADVDPSMFAGCRYFHVMGSSLTSENAIAAVKRGVIEAARVGAKISFDPNVRAEMLAFAPMRAALHDMLDACHLFLPSEADLPFFCGPQPAERAIAGLLATHPLLERVVLKRGAAGSAAFDRTGSVAAPAYETVEIDPTGAGDCFGGTFVACTIAGLPVATALARANAAGALAVSRVGPMEGNSMPDDIDRFLAERGVRCAA
ncbi:sugar kinase [Burkholderia humptydooensis]|uniref:Sugar kinase n=4 Tax=Burkholderia humptydooensis TaxID=430531 RepID=A0A7U4STB6_9BURK|nr:MULTISPECIES: sugar kinase [Burkholderia]AJY43652.1 pfkB carbohydrate kinase family protein [Burkholderia sp. 2002721687]ALX43577.1 carbohydrate kinase [Burkholderia humptydooensis]EIP90123.1 kinase, PfkB family protein [Burkholderia humptydooensis MSMB43]QPS44500.1 sugar kinase [Burkholderia humptydooensis]